MVERIFQIELVICMDNSDRHVFLSRDYEANPFCDRLVTQGIPKVINFVKISNLHEIYFDFSVLENQTELQSISNELVIGEYCFHSLCYKNAPVDKINVVLDVTDGSLWIRDRDRKSVV